MAGYRAMTLEIVTRSIEEFWTVVQSYVFLIHPINKSLFSAVHADSSAVSSSCYLYYIIDAYMHNLPHFARCIFAYSTVRLFQAVPLCEQSQTGPRQSPTALSPASVEF